MKKPNDWIDFGKATRPGSSNQVEIKFLIDKVVRQRIELFSNGKPVTRYADLDLIDKGKNNSAKFFMEIDNSDRKQWTEDEKEKITCFLHLDTYENEEKWKKAKREICIDLLKERYKSVLEHDYDCRDKDIAYNFTIIGKDKINITVRKKGEINSDKITYENEMIKEIEPIFYLTTAVRLDDTSEYQKVNRKLPEERPPFWTKGKVILLILVLIILALVGYFWKKIWRWIRGESSQEKKVREQIDIF